MTSTYRNSYCIAVCMNLWMSFYYVTMLNLYSAFPSIAVAVLWLLLPEEATADSFLFTTTATVDINLWEQSDGL